MQLKVSVNLAILKVLQSGKSRDGMALALERMAGREKKNEPTSIGNFRTAASQLRRGEIVNVL
jgi:hypothetical protein